MLNVRLKFVIDERKNPLAVQIDYSDWLTIQEILKGKDLALNSLNKDEDSIYLSEAPLAHQKRIRDES